VIIMTKTHQVDVSEPLPADEMLISTRVGLSRRAQANLSRAKDILTSKEMKDVKTEDIFRAWLEEYDPLTIASTYLDNQLKRLDTSICDFRL